MRRAQRLTDGVNLSGWLWGGGDNSKTHFETYITDADLKFIHRAGFRYVRLCWNPANYLRLPVAGPSRGQALQPLHRAVDMILANGLDVTISVFPNDDYKKELFTGDDSVARFTRMWREVAGSFAGTDPDRVYFEIMNEPEQPDAFRWIGIESQVVAAIRPVAPNHTILATGAHYSGLEDLLRTQPIADANVIYVFHFYEPFYFTHQGAGWTSEEMPDLKNVPYPATPAQVEALLPALPEDFVRLNLYDYASGGWNEETISGRIRFAADWGKRHHVPVICNEFGAYKVGAPADSRVRFLHDVRTAMEANNVPWAMWDYRGDFGVVERTPTQIKPDDAVLGALGLKTGLATVELTQ